jgi:hypothetical protein
VRLDQPKRFERHDPQRPDNNRIDDYDLLLNPA